MRYGIMAQGIAIDISGIRGNNDLFDERCDPDGTMEAANTVSNVSLVTVSADGLTLTTTNAELAAKAAGWANPRLT